MVHISKSIENILRKVPSKNLYNKKTLEILLNDKAPASFNNVDILKNQLPDGIYSSINQVITIIQSTLNKTIDDSISYSPISINYKEFEPLKLIKYDSGNIITGRDNEIEKILLTLCKKDKRGVILVGAAGTGKTSVVKAVNSRILEGKVPKELIGSVMYNMDIPYLFSKYKDDAVNYIIKAFETACNYDKALLFIDEVHQVLNQKMNDVLKPYLTEKIRFIGSTTIDEYYAIVTQDPAIERRFTIIHIDEPNIEQTVQMLCKTKSVYEDHHKIIIPDEICNYAVTVGSRFLGSRKNPDKSLDILDIACSILNKESIKVFYKNNKKYINLENKDNNTLCDVKFKSIDRTLTNDFIDKAISSIANIDYVSIQKSLDYNHVKTQLKHSIYGQSKQLEDMANVVNIIKHVNYNMSRPLSVILTVGTPGVGKKSSSKKLAELVFGDNNHFIEYDMSGLTSEFMITELKGSPPGYVGYGKSGGLVKIIRNNPQSVVYFRNIHRADPSIIEYILNCIRTGRMTDSAERFVNLNNTIIIMSVTLEKEELSKIISKKVMGFSSNTENVIDIVNNMKAIINKNIVQCADEIIVFNELDATTMNQIFDKNIEGFIKMYKGVELDIDDIRTKVLTDCKNGHDVMSKLTSVIPKLIFNQIKEVANGN